VEKEFEKTNQVAFAACLFSNFPPHIETDLHSSPFISNARCAARTDGLKLVRPNELEGANLGGGLGLHYVGGRTLVYLLFSTRYFC
jgi:hypothetical protein